MVGTCLCSNRSWRLGQCEWRTRQGRPSHSPVQSTQLLYYNYFLSLLKDAQIHRRGMWGAVAGALSVVELESSLVACTNEVVTVLFEVFAVEETRRGIRLDVVGSQYGFHVLIPSESDAAAVFAPLSELIGQTLSVTGILECDVRYGPWIEADSSAQIRVEDAASNDGT